MSLEDLFRLSTEEFQARLDGVPPAAWDETSRCCPDWTIRDLVNHVVAEFRWIPPLLAGKTIEEVGDALDGDLLGNDPRAAWQRAGTAVLDALGDEDVLGRTVHLSSGPTTAEAYLSEVLSDQVVHTWDLASSVGADEKLDPELVEFATRTLEPLAASWRKAGVLGDPIDVAADAGPQARLLALLGRRS